MLTESQDEAAGTKVKAPQPDIDNSADTTVNGRARGLVTMVRSLRGSLILGGDGGLPPNDNNRITSDVIAVSIAVFIIFFNARFPVSHSIRSDRFQFVRTVSVLMD